MNKKTLKKFMELPGIPGQEEVVAQELIKKLKANKLEVVRDNLGSVWGIKKFSDNAPTLLIDSHLDEAGFEVTGIRKDGKLKFEEQGFVDPKIMKGLRLKVYSENLEESYIGVVLTKITKDPKSPAPEIDQLLLDVGASTKEEVEDMNIKIGSAITFEGDVVYQGNSVIGKSADNRAGVSLIHELSDFIAKTNFNFNIVIGASVQEEVGLRGARTSANKFKPDLAMVVDVSPAFDTFGKKISEGNLGEGTLIRHKDACTIFPKSVINFARTVAKKNNIKVQDYFGKGGTNSGIIHISNSGVVTIPLGFPARNLHMPSQVFDVNDYEETLNLAKGMLKALNATKIKGFKQF